MKNKCYLFGIFGMVAVIFTLTAMTQVHAQYFAEDFSGLLGDDGEVYYGDGDRYEGHAPTLGGCPQWGFGGELGNQLPDAHWGNDTYNWVEAIFDSWEPKAGTGFFDETGFVDVSVRSHSTVIHDHDYCGDQNDGWFRFRVKKDRNNTLDLHFRINFQNKYSGEVSAWIVGGCYDWNVYRPLYRFNYDFGPTSWVRGPKGVTPTSDDPKQEFLITEDLIPDPPFDYEIEVAQAYPYTHADLTSFLAQFPFNVIEPGGKWGGEIPGKMMNSLRPIVCC